MATTNLVHAVAEDSIQEGAGTAVKVGNRNLAFFKVGGLCYAISNECPHMGGPLANGTLSGHIVTCPWHGWTWDVRTGKHARIPSKAVACFPVRAVDGQLYVEVPVEPDSPAAASSSG